MEDSQGLSHYAQVQASRETKPDIDDSGVSHQDVFVLPNEPSMPLRPNFRNIHQISQTLYHGGSHLSSVVGGQAINKSSMDFTLSKSPGTRNNSKHWNQNNDAQVEKTSKFIEMQNDITRLQDKIRGLENKLEPRAAEKNQSESGAQTDRIFEN